MEWNQLLRAREDLSYFIAIVIMAIMDIIDIMAIIIEEISLIIEIIVIIIIIKDQDNFKNIIIIN